MTAQEYIQHLNLQPHPEGGFYRQTYCSSENISIDTLPKRFTANRPFSTAIYYLLEQGDFSAFHKIKSDECWHFYAGQTLHIHVIEKTGNYYCVKLGNNLSLNETFQFVVPAEAWFAAEPAPETKFALVGCTVAPGFNFDDFEMAKKENLLQQYPHCKAVIDRLSR